MNLARLFTLCAFLSAWFPASAQPAQSSVAAVVNGDYITQRDLEQRTKLALLTSDLPDTTEMRGNVQAALLRRLIDEDLKIQAAVKEKITVSSDDVAAQIASIEQQNHLPAGGLARLLAARDIETEALRQQLRADIAWSKLVHYDLARRVHISDGAVETRLDALRANAGKPEYRVSEIFLSLDGGKDEAQVRDLADRLIQQLRLKVPFASIARQFNQAGAADGNLGWVSEGMLDDVMLKALDGLQPDMVTPPIRTTEGYHILTLLEKRKVGEGIGGGAAVDLMIIDLKSLTSASQAERDSQMQRLRETLAPAKNCDDLALLSKQAPSAAITMMEKLPEPQVPLDVTPLIKDLPPGRISEPITTPKGRRFFAVCGRKPGDASALPSADDIRHQMEEEQLELVARRYMLDLRRNAIIEMR